MRIALVKVRGPRGSGLGLRLWSTSGSQGHPPRRSGERTGFGADAAVDRRPRWARSWCRHRGRCSACVGLRRRRGVLHMLPRLFLALYHAAHVVVRANTTVDR